MKPQQQLEQFYESWKAKVPANLSGVSDLVGPDLIWIDDEYLNSSPRIAIIGKEQLGWDYTYVDFISKWSVAEAIAVYREFDLGLNYYASPFWQFFHAVRMAAFPNDGGARRKVLWTNVVKFVSADESPITRKPHSETALKLQQDILTTELSIAKPNVCLFVTGPSYDAILEGYFPGIHFEPLELPVRQFAKLVHPWGKEGRGGKRDVVEK